MGATGGEYSNGHGNRYTRLNRRNRTDYFVSTPGKKGVIAVHLHSGKRCAVQADSSGLIRSIHENFFCNQEKSLERIMAPTSLLSGLWIDAAFSETIASTWFLNSGEVI
jgi:hypothetical protein